MNLDYIKEIKMASRAKKILLFKRHKKEFKRTSLNIWFLNECLKKRVFPNFIQIKTSYKNDTTRRVEHEASVNWLRLELNKFYKQRDAVAVKLYYLHMDLSFEMGPPLFDCFLSKVFDIVGSYGSKIFKRLKTKLDGLINKKKCRTLQFKATSETIPHAFHQRTVNLTNVEFSRDEMDVLDRGLKYAPPPRASRKSFKLAVAHTEQVLNFLSKSRDDIILPQTSIINLFSNYKHSVLKSNENDVIKQTLAKIKLNSLFLTKADKGNCTIILNESTYFQKTFEAIADMGATKLHVNPLKPYVNKLRTTLKDSSETFQYFNTNYDRFLLKNPTIPKLYTLPKLHKPNKPHRPIVSFCNSPVHLLSHFLNKVLSSHINFHPKFSIKSSLTLCNLLESTVISGDCFLVSFDIVNLFPSVPPSECITLTRNLLYSSNLPNYVTQGLSDLLDVAMEQNFFQFKDCIYKQSSGLAMGSNLSPLMADIFMNNLETTMIVKHHLFIKHIKFWTRYVDDVFAIFKGTEDDLKEFLIFLNTVHANIRFTHELEINSSLSFLDLNIHRTSNTISFDIYRKPTATDHVIPYQSSHPLNIKLAAFHALFHRLLSIPLNQISYKTELNNIKQIARNNGFPDDLIFTLYHKIKRKMTLHRITSLCKIARLEKKFFSIPYIPRLSEKIQYALKKFNICISHKVNKTLKAIFSTKVDTIDRLQMSGVYKLSCTCGMFYIGRSFRAIKTRTDEHTKEITRKLANTSSCHYYKSSFAEHVLISKHKFNSNNPELDILHLCTKNQITNYLEIIEILSAKHTTPENLLNDVQDFNNVIIGKLVNSNVL